MAFLRFGCDFRPHHHFGHLSHRQIRHKSGPYELAFAQHRDLICECHHFSQFVGNNQHADLLCSRHRTEMA